MSRTFSRAHGAAGAIVLALCAASPLAGQQQFSMTGEAGVAIPGRQLHRFESPGPAGTMDVTYWVRSRIGVDLFGQMDDLRGATLATAQSPNLRVMNYGLGLEARLTAPAAPHWRLVGHVGLGASSFDAGQFQNPADSTASYSFKHTYPSTLAGLQAGYRIGPRIVAYVGSDVAWAFTKKDETQDFSVLSPDVIQPFNKAWMAPVTAGVTVGL